MKSFGWLVQFLTTPRFMHLVDLSNGDQQSYECLLRYLRATKWNANEAIEGLEGTLKWRREFGIYEKSRLNMLNQSYAAGGSSTSLVWRLITNDEGGNNRQGVSL
jgi:hypothetical protein